jgi:hypothetical protein
MRDIRGDLQERANLITEQISSVQGQLDNRLQQLKREHETRLEDLRSVLRNLHMVFGIEERRLGTSMSGTKSQQGGEAPRVEPEKPLSVIRKVVGRR